MGDLSLLNVLRVPIKIMKTARQLFKQHPASVITYLLYTSLCCLTLIAQWRNKYVHKYFTAVDRHYDAGVMGGFMLLFLIGFPFLLISMLNIPRYNGQERFYMRLSSLIVIQFFLLIFFYGVLSDIYSR